ncbi:hypothetical protein GCM10018954_098070 [Kutzneria kofuensis]
MLDELTELADRLSKGVLPVEARPAARVLYGEAIRIYARVLDGEPGVGPDQRARVRAAGRALVAAGGSPDTAADHLGRVLSHLVEVAVAEQRPQRLSTVVSVGNLVLRDLLTGARDAGPERGSRPRWEVVQRLVAGEVPPGAEHELAAGYDIVLLRPSEDVPRPRLAELLDEFEGLGVLGAPVDASVVLLIPATLDYSPQRAVEHWAARLGASPWCATAHRSRDRIASGYEEAADILTLAVASGRPPGVFRLDDFLIEYAVLRQSAVTDSLFAIVKPVLANDMLRETLSVLIESDFNRNAAAQALYIHRSTLDYRIHRIEEATGYSPMSGRGAQVLTVAMTASAVADVVRRREVPASPTRDAVAGQGFAYGKRCSQ